MKICYIPATKKSVACYSVNPIVVTPILYTLRNISSIIPNIAWGLAVLGLIIEVLKLIQSNNVGEFKKGMIRVSGAALIAFLLPYIPEFIDKILERAFDNIVMPSSILD